MFFLVAGLEIRRELYEGALSNVRLATLPLAAAVGGVVMPALIYLGFNSQRSDATGLGGADRHGYCLRTGNAGVAG